MRPILGIDAAWTAAQPSGVALLVQTSCGWQLAKVEPSYEQFLEIAERQVLSETSLAEALLDRTTALTGETPALVAIDMPLSLSPIFARRASDDAVSRAYGAKHCSTHTPSTERPGSLSDRLRQDFAQSGFALRTADSHDGKLCEVYPHPALVELVDAPRRLPYKLGKIASYWPDLSQAERRVRLIEEWAKIVAALDAKISGVANHLTLPSASAPRTELKAFEDMLDAVVCAWVGTCVLDGRAKPFGDADSAIWIPEHCNEGTSKEQELQNAEEQATEPTWSSVRSEIQERPVGVHTLRVLRVADSIEEAARRPNAEPALHLLSRVGVACAHIAKGLEDGSLNSADAAQVLRQLAALGQVSFEQWCEVNA